MLWRAASPIRREGLMGRSTLVSCWPCMLQTSDMRWKLHPVAPAAEVKTGGEVIMCAGAIHTPHLLQLSGIGPQEELSRQGISTVADLQSVGRNLQVFWPHAIAQDCRIAAKPHDQCVQDHPAVLAAYLMKEEAGLKSVTDELMTRKGRVRVRAALNFLLRRRGPITTTGCDHGALVSTRGAIN